MPITVNFGDSNDMVYDNGFQLRDGYADGLATRNNRSIRFRSDNRYGLEDKAWLILETRASRDDGKNELKVKRMKSMMNDILHEHCTDPKRRVMNKIFPGNRFRK